MGLARSTFYDVAPVPLEPAELVARIGAICDEFECYGYRRVGAALRHQGVVVNSKKLRRLMREHDLQPKRRRRYVVTTDSDHAGPIFPDLAKDVIPERPNQLWVADLTYVAIPSGFVYLAAILDAWSRKVVGYAIRAASTRGEDPGELLPGVHRIASLAKRWLLGTHQGAVDSAHLPSYLDEFAFRFNRRRSRSRGMLFYRVLELAVAHGPVRYQDLVMSQSPKAVPPKPPRHRGHPPSLERPSPNRPWRQIVQSG